MTLVLTDSDDRFPLVTVLPSDNSFFFDTVIDALGGNDYIVGDKDGETILGRAGNDILFGGGWLQLNTVGSQSGQGTKEKPYVLRAITQESGNDTLNGGDGSDILIGSDGNDILIGGNGNDGSLMVFRGNQIFKAGLWGGSGNDTISGGNGNDDLYGDSGTDTLRGGASNDLLQGGSGTDKLFGDSGRDLLRGGSGNDTLTGGSSNDRLEGGTGIDRMLGESGDDYLLGGTNNDSLDGGSSDDTLEGGKGRDKLVGGTGSDTAAYFTSAGVTASLEKPSINTGDAAGDTYASVERLVGSEKGADKLTGNSKINILLGYGGADQLRGQGADDYLKGGANADKLYGGTGRDTLAGGTGKDLLYGGTGSDGFYFEALNECGDKVMDFGAGGIGDLFLFKSKPFGNLAAGKIEKQLFHRSTSGLAHDKSDRFIYDTNDYSLWYDADGTGGAQRILVADITTPTLLTEANILIFA
jgi:Ca2+-binding RTX toxin-like protein